MRSEAYSIFPIKKSVRRSFNLYPLERQYEIVQIGNALIGPPMTELTDEFAENGQAIVPIIQRGTKIGKNLGFVSEILPSRAADAKKGVFTIVFKIGN